jgi:cytoskeleton protein RodZ
MNENVVMQDTVSNQENSSLNSQTTAGQLLKQARLDAGLHIAALAVSLRVPVKRIEALENGQMDLLPDVVFVRALTSSICQVLKIDAVPILNKLPKVTAPRLNRDDIALNTPISDGKVGKVNQDRLEMGIFTSPLLLGVLFLCVGTACVYFWPAAKALSISETSLSSKALSEVGVTQAKEVQVATEIVPIPSPNANSNPNPPANNVLVALPLDAIVAPASLPLPTALPVSVSDKTIAQNALAVTENLVTFKATGDTWVEVKSPKTGILFKKLLRAGETGGTSGAVPLTVIVGRADVTQVEVRGKPINLAAIAKSNVARFEVK